GIKNTKAPMYAFMLGSSLFVLLDYALIFGAWGLPQLGLKGSALASVIQYAVMLVFILGYVLLNERCRKYGIELLASFKQHGYWKELLFISIPVIIDKATLAFAYLWLCALMKPLGVAAVATFSVLKDMERFALVPAIAFAQIVTLLVSNDYGIQNWPGIKSNIKKIVFMASSMVMFILVVLSFYARTIVQWFDRTGDFTDLAARVFPIISVLVFFDVLQLILSGALRGSANVRLVMMVRLIICVGYFVPVSYMISCLPIADPALKLVLIYSSFYIGNALMSVIYINRFRSEGWKTN
ncbi:MAG TPA: MATE family efflux transporter, partial [Candidatus Limnocylindria bacterium]|nr:MATE family efflux transporter [Candidatus Limnocylindria bacterium]